MFSEVIPESIFYSLKSLNSQDLLDEVCVTECSMENFYNRNDQEKSLPSHSAIFSESFVNIRQHPKFVLKLKNQLMSPNLSPRTLSDELSQTVHQLH